MKKKNKQLYTDFCDELVLKEHVDETISYVVSSYEECTITHIEVLAKENALEKEIGDYITIEYPSLHEQEKREHIITCIVEKMQDLFKKIEKPIQKVLVVGLGNKGAVSDALGPKSSEQILVTAHLYANEQDMNLEGTREVASIAPGVMGQTGLESAQMVASIVKMYAPDVVLAIDALSTSSLQRINRAIQINNTGIKPGGGVGNHRLELDESSLQVPVIAIGVATVTSIGTILKEATQALNEPNLLDSLHEVMDMNLIVTPKNMDDELSLLVTIISEALNRSIHPDYQNL